MLCYKPGWGSSFGPPVSPAVVVSVAMEPEPQALAAIYREADATEDGVKGLDCAVHSRDADENGAEDLDSVAVATYGVVEEDKDDRDGLEPAILQTAGDANQLSEDPNFFYELD